MKRLLAVALAAVASVAQGQESTQPDTTGWACKFCQFEAGTSGWFGPTFGHLSGDPLHLVDYRSEAGDSVLGWLGGAWRFRGEDNAKGWDLGVERLGLGSHAVHVRGGEQGRYRLTLEADSVATSLAREGETPFRFGDNLPPGWFTAGSTAGMSALGASLHDVTIDRQRKRTGLGIALVPRPSTDVTFDYHRDRIDGTGLVGGSFMTLAAQLPRPLGQTTDRFDASASYRHPQAYATLSLNTSYFSNDYDALAWQNPYGALAPGATFGQMANAPDNRAQRLGLLIGSAPGTPWQVTAQYAIGQLRQDQRFVAATVNPNEATALPRPSLDGRVDTTLASARASYRVSPALRISADALHDERKNRTDSDAYTQVVMDVFTNGVRTNVPYSFARDRFRASVEWAGRPRLAAGMTEDQRERRLSTRRDTRELTYWGRLGWQTSPGSDLRLRLAHATRSGADNFSAAADMPAQNPAVRGFNAADRDRDEARAEFTLAQGLVTQYFNVSYARSDYPATRLGRTADDAIGYGVGLGAQPLENLALNLFASHEQQRADQAGSQSFASPDWFAEIDDASDVVGVRADWTAVHGFDFGADYVLSASTGNIAMVTTAGASDFPMRVTRWHDARLHASYAATPKVSLRLDLQREVYAASDWALDGVGPATLSNLLAIGETSRDGNVTVVLLSLRQQF